MDSEAHAVHQTKASGPPAHDAVYTRLGVSRIHGVGVFAVVDIPVDTDLFSNDDSPIVWTTIKSVKKTRLTRAIRKLYHDFGVVRGDLVGVPANFNCLTTGWYVNEPMPGEAANVAMTEGFHFIACRDIATGEEITATYASFSDPVDERAESLL